MPDPLPDWINEYIEWCKARGERAPNDERIEELKKAGGTVILYDDNGKPESRKFGNVPERLTYEQVRPLFEWAFSQLDNESPGEDRGAAGENQENA